MALVTNVIDIQKDRTFCLAACVPCVAPNQLNLDGFEKRFNHGIVVTISITAHRYLEVVFLQPFWVLV